MICFIFLLYSKGPHDIETIAKYGHFLVKTAMFDPENVRNAFSILNNPQHHANIVQIGQAIVYNAIHLNECYLC